MNYIHYHVVLAKIGYKLNIHKTSLFVSFHLTPFPSLSLLSWNIAQGVSLLLVKKLKCVNLPPIQNLALFVSFYLSAFPFLYHSVCISCPKYCTGCFFAFTKDICKCVNCPPIPNLALFVSFY